MKKLRGIILLILLVVAVMSIIGCESKPKCTKITRTNKGCDKIEGCTCLHESWGGFGACDSCECTVCK